MPLRRFVHWDRWLFWRLASVLFGLRRCDAMILGIKGEQIKHFPVHLTQSGFSSSEEPPIRQSVP